MFDIRDMDLYLATHSNLPDYGRSLYQHRHFSLCCKGERDVIA